MSQPGCDAHRSYDYGITSTPTHCPGLPGTCGTPKAGDVVFYRWPVTLDRGRRYLRNSAVEHGDQFLTLPFTDTAVQRKGIWLYGSGSWHHAGDYQRSDADAFPVVASAAGRVIHIGWDNWSGNTVIVSHDAGGVQDAFRTIYMHLRNGATNDVQASWAQSVPSIGDDADLSAFVEHLEATGCPKNGPWNPDPAHWGTEDQTIDMTLLGATVDRGQFLGWAGSTGAGGKRGPGGPNNHLHIFWSRRDPTNDEWYFFDPHGIYATPDCYPSDVTGAITGPCARYAIAWSGGSPQYPPA